MKKEKISSTHWKKRVNRKMKIVNKTTWSTSDLQKLFKTISEHEGYAPRTIEVVYSKNTGIGGVASINGSWVKMKICNRSWNRLTDEYMKMTEIKDDDIIRLGQVYVHEIGHNMGLKHKDMLKCDQIDVEYIKDFIITREEKSNHYQRKKLKNLHYKGHVAKIYRYPWKVICEKVWESKEIYGFWYTFIIHNKITKQRIYRLRHRDFFENINEVHKKIKSIINRKINST